MGKIVLAFTTGVLVASVSVAAAADPYMYEMLRAAQKIASALERANQLTERKCR